jgi:hypothetical protein
MSDFIDAVKEYLETDPGEPLAVKAKNKADEINLEELGFTIKDGYGIIDKLGAMQLIEAHEQEFDFQAHSRQEFGGSRINLPRPTEEEIAGGE